MWNAISPPRTLEGGGPPPPHMSPASRERRPSNWVKSKSTIIALEGVAPATPRHWNALIQPGCPWRAAVLRRRACLWRRRSDTLHAAVSPNAFPVTRPIHSSFPRRGPITRVGHKTFAHWVVTHIFPLLHVAFRVAQRAIPISLLPHARPQLSGEATLPERDPVSQFQRVAPRRGKEMHMIRHNDVSPDQPRRRVLPCVYQRIVRDLIGENRAACFGAYGDKNDCRAIRRRRYIVVRTAALRERRGRHSPCSYQPHRRRGATPSNWVKSNNAIISMEGVAPATPGYSRANHIFGVTGVTPSSRVGGRCSSNAEPLKYQNTCRIRRDADACESRRSRCPACI